MHNGNCGALAHPWEPLHPFQAEIGSIMALTNPFGDLEALEELWRQRLEEFGKRYEAEHTPESRAAHMQVLKIFADLVMRRSIPME
jgi:hypothetical protein